MSKTKCDYLECRAENTLIVMVLVNGREFGTCPNHSWIVENYGAVVVDDDKGRQRIFSPTEIDGYV